MTSILSHPNTSKAALKNAKNPKQQQKPQNMTNNKAQLKVDSKIASNFPRSQSLSRK